MTDQHVAASPRQRNAPRAGTPAIVNVFARTSAGGGIRFSHTWRWEDGTPGGSDAIHIPEKKKDEPGTPIHFHLKDETRPNLGLDFTDDDDGPMWVKRDTCPPEHQRCGDPQIPESKMQRGLNLLRVFDENTEECTLHYRLRFKDRNGKPESYDPDIRNGGTTT